MRILRRRSAGFSLIELVIAVSLASFVLVGVASIAAQMARSQVEGIRSGTVTGWSLISYLSMSKELEDANVLAYPVADGTAVDSVVVCKNWSRVMNGGAGGKLNTNATPPGANFVSIVQYCLDSAAPANLILRRFERLGAGVICPAAVGAPATCTAIPSSPWGAWSNTGVVGFRVERLAGASVFTRANSVGGVRVRYVVGHQVGTPNEPAPKSTPFDISIAMQKQYNNTSD